MVKKTETPKLAAEKRNELGSRPATLLRRNGWLPCVVYSSHEPSQAIKINRHDLEILVHHHGGQNIIIDLDIDGKTTKKVLLKDLQRDHIKDLAIHADFLEISMTQKLRMMVDIALVGEPTGVTQQNGVLEHLLRAVEVECLPEDIVKEFQLDVSALEINDRLFVRDIKVDPKLTIITLGDIAVASVRMPRVEEEPVPAEEEAAGAAEAAEEEKEEAGEKKEEEGKDKEPGAQKEVDDKAEGKKDKKKE